MGVERKNNTYRYQLDNTNTARELEYDFELPDSAPGPEADVQKTRNGAKRRQRKKRRQQARIRAFVTALIIIIALGGLAVKAAHVHLIKGTQVRLMEEDIKKLNLENEGLKRQIDLLSSVKHIEQAALAMGMEKPGGTIYVDKNLLPAKTQEEIQVHAARNTAEESTGVSASKHRIQTAAAVETKATETQKEKTFLEKLFERFIAVIS
ncbi:MAG: hypothetical protein FWG14_05745 [Peptococcaceae bacterium]|nr:hypothetical protein [Peptococcaceae bacterium]